MTETPARRALALLAMAEILAFSFGVEVGMLATCLLSIVTACEVITDHYAPLVGETVRARPDLNPFHRA